MTQRVDLATVMDRLAIDALLTDYAVAVDDGDWLAYRSLFSPDGRADYSSAGGIEGAADEVAEWLAGTLRIFPVRQHLIVNRRLRFGALDGDVGDTAQVQADYTNPMCTRPDGSAPDFECGGRYAFSVLRTRSGWRVTTVVVHEKWRRTAIGPRTAEDLREQPPSPRQRADGS
ncbi:nuclear transport factor 2 family protein [Streptomyces sp. B-S-A8]|uniref:Nuclear transport factor 2 family protein n=1 Tax=Streptomyces solicavernae TaxID=3043614 RepID=A0ABT6RUH0_9ACTN|nr:nuclear transport factor 2 family protein [Streptomyces sp. B-S-A8]MDI3388084.1 nuclear transport factor 2 family protein [Streptomyces sp. B-S-A8]